MARKIKLAVNWAAACGGCDVSILDLEEAVLQLVELADLVYWPVALDFKRQELMAMANESIDIGLFNGAIRTSEQEEDAHLLRERCKVLVAFGACACFGGIPGLANITGKEQLQQTIYDDTASTDNPHKLRPVPEYQIPGQARVVELPELLDSVKALHQVVDVDLFLPGCPPPPELLGRLVEVVASATRGEAIPPKGTFIASDKGLCDECPRRETRGTREVEHFVRPHEIVAREDLCLLDQGLVCAGVGTRGGCGASCIQVNMPCRGCLGPLPEQLDPAADLVSALAALPGPRGNWEMPIHKIVNPARSVTDPLGTFYRFSYPVSLGRRTKQDLKRGD